MDVPIRVVLIDDNETFLRVASRFLAQEDRLQVDGAFRSAAGHLRQIEDLAPDVILLDYAMGDLNGLDALPKLRAIAPAAKIIMLTMHDQDHYRKLAQERGAAGYVAKDAMVDTLLPVLYDLVDR